jgi:hypothetical protein
VLDRRAGHDRSGRAHDVVVRPAVTLAIGVVGGLIVGITSVGSGSLMIILMLFAYPALGANALVGTDLTQAVPLTLSAALGALVFGHVVFGLTASLILGSVPAVFVGSLLSSTVPDRYVRPAIAFVILASGLKYIGLGTTELGWTLCVLLLAAALGWLAVARPWRVAPGAPTSPGARDETEPTSRFVDRDAQRGAAAGEPVKEGYDAAAG